MSKQHHISARSSKTERRTTTTRRAGSRPTSTRRSSNGQIHSLVGSIDGSQPLSRRAMKRPALHQRATDSKHTSAKYQEAEPKMREIELHLGLQKDYFIKMIEISSLLIGLSLQANVQFLPVHVSVSPLICSLVSIIGAALATKISAHDNRVGQLNYHLRRIIGSVWEIVRRVLWDNAIPTAAEAAILRKEQIVIDEAMKREAQKNKPLFRDMHAVANRICFLGFELLANALLTLSTGPAATHGDMLTILTWVASACAMAFTRLCAPTAALSLAVFL